MPLEAEVLHFAQQAGALGIGVSEKAREREREREKVREGERGERDPRWIDGWIGNYYERSVIVNGVRGVGG